MNATCGRHLFPRGDIGAERAAAERAFLLRMSKRGKFDDR
jgi:hypothetical protein